MTEAAAAVAPGAPVREVHSLSEYFSLLTSLPQRRGLHRPGAPPAPLTAVRAPGRAAGPKRRLHRGEDHQKVSSRAPRLASGDVISRHEEMVSPVRLGKWAGEEGCPLVQLVAASSGRQAARLYCRREYRAKRCRFIPFQPSLPDVELAQGGDSFPNTTGQWPAVNLHQLGVGSW